jgi:4-hydroxy-4-methyl-2-oxoglutarate aldolase
MTKHLPPEISLGMVRESLTAAVVSDALDALGYRDQAVDIVLRPLTVARKLVGRAKTTLWADMWHDDPRPYELELAAVDGCRPEDVFVAAASGSRRSGIWGELLSTAASNQGCVGAVVDGAVRDVAQMTAMDFVVYARGTCIRDSQHRQRVIDVDVPVEIGGVTCRPGDLLIADADGVVVVPQAIEREVLLRAWAKVHDENITRDAIRAGLPAAEAYRKYGVL